MKQERLRRLQGQSEFIARMERSGISRLFANGPSLNVQAISPHVQFCTSRQELDIFRFLRLLQSIPAPRLLYRQLAMLVRDHGQEYSPVMGIIGLSSTVYSMGCRDRFFGWTGQENRNLKNDGLKSCMQLSICMGVPPYSYLRVGRLMAALATSDLVAAEFSRRYSNAELEAQLRAIVTTSAMGLHSPIFNRIMLRPGGLYRRIGETSGYSILFFTKETHAVARKVVTDHDGYCPATTDRPIRNLKRALTICGVPQEDLLTFGTRKGVYAAVGGSQSVAPSWPTVSQIVDYWKFRDLAKALIRRDLISKVRNFRYRGILVCSRPVRRQTRC